MAEGVLASDLLPAVIPPVQVEPDSPDEQPDEPDEGEQLLPRRAAVRPLVRLTEDAAKAAILDAWGASRASISEELGVGLSTVSWWRKSPVYIEARALETEKVIADAKSRLQRDRHGAFEAREEARQVLREQLQATDAEGYPQHGLRQAAAKILLEDKAATSEYGDGKLTGDVKIAVGAVFHVLPDGKVVEATEIIEVEAEEVS